MSEDRPVIPQRRSRFFPAVVSLLLAVLVIFVSLLALGILEVRLAGRAGSEPGASPQAGNADESTPTARVTNVTSSSPLMPFIDSSGHCFKYEGAWVECWIEIEENGQKSVVAEIRGFKDQAQLADADNRLKVKPPSGYIVWVSRSESDRKAWHLWASAIDEETGKAFVYQTSRSKPKTQLIEAPYFESPSPRDLLKAGTDVVLVTRKEIVDEKITRTARLVCRVLE